MFIIEHESRGVLVEQETEPYDTGSLSVHDGTRTRFSWSRSRRQAQQFSTLTSARNAMDKINPRLRQQCQIKRWGTWESVR